MGFYFELKKTVPGGYREAQTPPVFWGLYFFAGFALSCMFGAAYAVLGDLMSKGSTFDRAIVYSVGLSLPLYLLAGVKLLGVRKFVRFEKTRVRVGHELFSWVLFQRVVEKSDVTAIELINQRPTQNLAPARHGDSQYYIRGHWRVLALRKGKKPLILDRHTEKGALAPLYKEAQLWLA